MTAFWIVASILVATVLWLLSSALLGHRRLVWADRNDQNVHIASERLQELEADLREYLARRCRDASEVDDVLQEVFVAALRHHTELRDDQRLAAWLWAIARNAIAIAGEIDIYTLGRDGRPGGEGLDADIGNWDPD